jgi:lysophospholipase L1-like esterase
MLNPEPLHYPPATGVGGSGVFAIGFNEPITTIQASQQAFEESKSRGIKYDYVVVMVGINDLLRMGKPADEIKQQLVQNIYKPWLESGTSVVAIPPFAAPGFVSR